MKNEEIRKKLDELSDDASSNWREKADERVTKKGWLLKSAYVALQVLDALKEKKISKSELAERMNVSRQWINEVVKGRENMTLQVIDKLEQALEIEIEIRERKKTVEETNWLHAEVKSMVYTGIEQHYAQAYLFKVGDMGFAQYPTVTQPRMIMRFAQAFPKAPVTYAQGSYVMQTSLKKLQESYDIE